MNAETPDESTWACEQIGRYREVQERYQAQAEALGRLLRQAVRPLAPLAIVETRAKEIASFAEKAQRKKDEHPDPVNQFTDLCGARVITHTYAEVELVCQLIEREFAIDAANSVKISQRLKPNEFGYRSVHYVVQLRRDSFAGLAQAVAIPDAVYPDPSGIPAMKAEIQVRTLLEHAWAVFSHERAYKCGFEIPPVWERELAGLAAVLEQADQAFARIQTGLRTYAASYGAYMKPERVAQEIQLLEVVLACDGRNAAVAHRIARLAMAVEDWDRAIGMLEPLAEGNGAALLRDLGVALCKKHEEHPRSEGYLKGRRYLDRACDADPGDPDAWASRASAYRDDPNLQREYHRRAFAADPTDPYALTRLVTEEIRHAESLAPVGLLEPSMRASMQRCRDQIEVGVNMPWAYYSLGLFHLLLDEPERSLTAYAKATAVSTAAWMLETSLKALRELEPVAASLRGYRWLVKWPLLALQARFPEVAAAHGTAALGGRKIDRAPCRVLIVAGGTGPEAESVVANYRQLLVDGLRNYQGIVISGGTRAGVAALVGDAQAAIGQPMHSIGYVPARVPLGIERDCRYCEERQTDGNDFSALEVIQYWIDLLASGVHPSDVQLLGINGGAISAVEYRLALALGAQVIVIVGSGRAADELLKDRDWCAAPNLIPLPADASALAAMLDTTAPIKDATQRETLGRAIHETYRNQQSGRLAQADPSMVDWDHLVKYLQSSNLQQADHVAAKLESIGCVMLPAGEPAQAVTVFTPQEVETMAEMEHGRWVAERLKAGWRYGRTRDVAKKTSPYLVAWADLDDSVREWDRATVRNIPQFLAQIGFQVHRQ